MDVQAMSTQGCEQFLRVTRTHRVEFVGKGDSALEQIELPVFLEDLLIPELRRNAQRSSLTHGSVPLIPGVVQGQHTASLAPASI